MQKLPEEYRKSEFRPVRLGFAGWQNVSNSNALLSILKLCRDVSSIIVVIGDPWIVDHAFQTLVYAEKCPLRNFFMFWTNLDDDILEEWGS